MKSFDPLGPAYVNDRESFFTFVRALVADREAAVEAEKKHPTDTRILGLQSDAGGWYNFTIDSYLNAALAWAESTGMGETQGLSAGPSWEAFAAFLLSGTAYE